MLKLVLCACCLAVAPPLVAAQAPGRTEAITAVDTKSSRAIVEAQLAALAGDRPAQAFGYATPAIQQQFQDADAFMAMVRQHYPMLIKPVAVSFFLPEPHPGGVIQAVHFRDHDGRLWRAFYELQRQPDRSWRINGCSVVADDAAATT